MDTVTDNTTSPSEGATNDDQVTTANRSVTLTEDRGLGAPLCITQPEPQCVTGFSWNSSVRTRSRPATLPVRVR